MNIIFYIYLIAWKLACDLRFHDVLLTKIIRQRTKDDEEIENIENIEKYSQKNVRTVYNSLCGRMCVYVCLCRLYLHIIVCGRISDILYVCV